MVASGVTLNVNLSARTPQKSRPMQLKIAAQVTIIVRKRSESPQLLPNTWTKGNGLVHVEPLESNYTTITGLGAYFEDGCLQCDWNNIQEDDCQKNVELGCFDSF